MSAALIFQSPSPRIFTIAPERAFLPELARTLRAGLSASGFALCDARIYVPTRRATRALGEAFVETAPNRGEYWAASLLPQIRALGDIDEDEFVAFAGAAEDELDLAPAISSMERRFVLARLIAAREEALGGAGGWAGALSAADELGRLLDSLYTEEISAKALISLVPDNLAAHWRQSLDFLSIITKAWPAYLAERGLTDPADRRVKLIDRQTQAWKKSPPTTPIIIAGTTGSAPAVARMMKTVARLPAGGVVLPGLDLTAPEAVWDKTDETHPQAGLARLLDRLEIARNAVRPWPREAPGEAPYAISARSEIISVALRPADASDSWREWALASRADPALVERALNGVELIEARDEESEAEAVAIKIRAAIEDSSVRVMMVSPDRDIARRVAAKLRRWNISVDDSAGVPFANTPCGIYLRLAAAWLADPSDAVAAIALMRHPLFGAGCANRARERAVNAMDVALRGLRGAPGAAGLKDKVAAAGVNAKRAEPALSALCAALEKWPGEGADFQARLNAHLEIAEDLAATDTMPGAERLWRGEDGEEGGSALARAGQAGAAIDRHAPRDYPDIFRELIAPIAVRRRRPAHPRIAILGPLEARLQHADIVILSGLNEGVWPRDAAIDPFLSRPMRRTLGLPSPEQRIALAAHDFAQLCAAPQIALTRATRAAGKPTKPSRWIMRLKNILAGAGRLQLIDKSAEFETLARRLDAAEKYEPVGAPYPRPPVEARPTKFFVTRIEKLLRDPYAIYARYILRLKKLDEPNEALDARHVGNLFHTVLQHYAQAPLLPTHAARMDALTALFDEHASQFGLNDDHLPFWRKRAEGAFEFIAQWDAARRQLGAPAVIEGEGAWSFDVDAHQFTLTAKADRIDRLADGRVFIVDYKTGEPPSLKQTAKFNPQLPLTAIIAAEGGFEALSPAPGKGVEVAGFEYLRLTGRSGKNDDVGAEGADCAKLMQSARDGLFDLMRHFADPQSAYPSQPRAQYIDVYGDYDHLARRAERNAQGGEE